MLVRHNQYQILLCHRDKLDGRLISHFRTKGNIIFPGLQTFDHVRSKTGGIVKTEINILTGMLIQISAYEPGNEVCA